jgi:tetratricopeptide (TPR) repeat protein
MTPANVRWPLLAAALLPLLLGATPTPADRADDLLRAGDRAFARGAYAEAADLYERASGRTADPGLAAFNLASAHYQLARAGNAGSLAEAEQAYRCCTTPGEPRRARALFGLGNCLLLRPADPTLLRSAIDRFSECLADPGCDDRLAADARHNRQRARLLLQQTPPPADAGPDDEGGGDEPKDDPPEQPAGAPEKQPAGAGDESAQGKEKAAPGQVDPNQSPDKEGAHAAGRGVALPPVSAAADAAQLGEQDAAEHLERATRRILDEMRQHRRSRTRPAPPGVRDW